MKRMNERSTRQQDDDGRDARAYFRVRTHIPLRFRQLGREEVDYVSAEIAAGGEEGIEPIDAGLAIWLTRLENKLDQILAALEVPDANGLSPFRPRPAVLSGSGMRFATVEKEQGTTGYLLIEFELPGTPPHTVRCVGLVLSSDRLDDESDLGESSIAIQFESIRETDRDAIVQHTLDVQRAELRRRRKSSRD